LKNNTKLRCSHTKLCVSIELSDLDHGEVTGYKGMHAVQQVHDNSIQGHTQTKEKMPETRYNITHTDATSVSKAGMGAGGCKSSSCAFPALQGPPTPNTITLRA